MRYSRVCGSYHDFIDTELLLARKLLNKWFIMVEVINSKVYGHHHDLVNSYGVSVSQMAMTISNKPIH